jgi:hypothetical protein
MFDLSATDCPKMENRTFVQEAAKVSEEPILPDAAETTNGSEPQEADIYSWNCYADIRAKKPM